MLFIWIIIRFKVLKLTKVYLESMSWYGEEGNRVDSTGEKTLNNLREKV